MGRNKQKFNWQPVSFLPKIAEMIDGMLESAEENLENLSQAKNKPHVMDDYTVGRIFEVYGTQKADFWMYDEQLDIWQKNKTTEKQRIEISRLQDQMVKLKKVVDKNLEIAEHLKKNTIEKVLAKSDLQLGLEALLGETIDPPMAPPLPSLIFNRGFIESFTDAKSPCAALGDVEIQGHEKGFLAIKLENPIPEYVTQNGFDLGTQLLEIRDCAVLHLILHFSQNHIYDVLLNLNTLVVKKVLKLWKKTGDYFFMTFSSGGGLTLFSQMIGESWYNDNYFDIIEKANNTMSEYEQAVDIFNKNKYQHGTYLNLVLQNDIEFLELNKNRFEVKSC